jgi:Carbohydrate binding domain (family 11)
MASRKCIISALFACIMGSASYGSDIVLYDGQNNAVKNLTIKTVTDPIKPKNMVGDFTGAAVGRTFGIVPADKDFSNYKALSFRIYAKDAQGAQLMLALTSDPEGKRGNYYYKKIKIDWDGWKTFTIPFDKLGVSRKPVGFNSITAINFHSRGWGIEPMKTAKLFIDDIKLIVK